MENNDLHLDDDFLDLDKDERNIKPWGMELKQFTVLMHLSQLASVIIPLGGIILPIVMWTTNKDQSKTVDEHGKTL